MTQSRKGSWEKGRRYIMENRTLNMWVGSLPIHENLNPARKAAEQGL